MKLYHGGYGKFKHYVVADTEENAIKVLHEKHNLSTLPVTVEAIEEVDGYKILAIDPNAEEKEVGQTKITEEAAKVGAKRGKK